MTMFILSTALLASLAVVLLTHPLWRRARAKRADSALLMPLREQVRQLQTLHAAGTLDDAGYAQARATLERRLVDAVLEAPGTASATPWPRLRGLTAVVSIFVLSVAVAGYLVLGTPAAIDAPLASLSPRSGGAGHAVTPEKLERMLDDLTQRLKTQPDDAKGWAMLARSNAALGRHEQALPAFKRASELQGNDAQLMADYADTVAMLNGRRVSDEAARLVQRALEIEPDHLKALSLAGTFAFDQGDYTKAIGHWQRMIALAPEHELTRQVVGGVDEARLRLGTPPSAPSASSASVAAKPARVSGTVSLSPLLAGQVRDDDTVFVFARAAEGARMPLAILRKRVRDLPAEFTLDDSQAMSPAARLSSAARVVVGARVSRNGSATPEAGDVQGFSQAVALGASGLRIEMAERVR